MLKNYIKETLVLNKIDLSDVDGFKLYYSKTKNLLSVLFYVLMIVFCIILIVMSKNDISIVMIYTGGLLVFTYAVQEALSRVLNSNPVLILSKDKVYYIKTQKWYNIEDYKFEDVHVGRFNLNLTFCMEDKNKKKVIALNNWHLQNPEEFKSKLKYHKAMNLKARQHK